MAEDHQERLDERDLDLEPRDQVSTDYYQEWLGTELPRLQPNIRLIHQQCLHQ